MSFLITELIKIKRSKKELSEVQIKWIIASYSNNKIPDYQMSSLLMAIFLNGMTKNETHYLTQAMLHSGSVIDFNNPNNFYVDKHSSGGVGDKTSMILTSIVACFNKIKVPMISGRGLGHTGGTLDKLESIPNFNIKIDNEKFKLLVNLIGGLIVGQTAEICPADKKIYALRDATSTVESLPLICSSIMSKKLAEGINGLVLDIKVGSGAFMKTMKDAQALALGLKNIGLLANKKMSVLISNMNQPLGRFSGNSLEIKECIEIMENKQSINSEGLDLYSDTRELSLILASEMVYLSGQFKSLKEAYNLCKQKLESGEALAKFKQIVKSQGGYLDQLPTPKYSLDILPKKSGYIESIETEQIGICGIQIRAGRAKSEDTLDYTAGIEFFKKIGSPIKRNEVLFKLFGDDLSLLESQKENILNTVNIVSKKTKPIKLILKKI